MRYLSLLVAAVAVGLAVGGCKKKENGEVSAALMKSETADASLALRQASALVGGTGSTVQSFTPESLKIAVYGINVCQGQGSCKTIYTCGGSVAECSVELSDIDAFVNTLNAGTSELEAGEYYDHIGVSFCPDGDTSGIQHLTLRGTVNIDGQDYGTDQIAGLVEGTEGSDVTIDIQGGCASFYPITPGFTVSAGEPTTVKLFFDASNFVYGGFAGGGANDYDYLGSESCVGDSGTFVCAQVTTVVATVDSGNPTTEHYLLADTNESLGGSADSAPTSSIVLYYNSAGVPIGGVQGHYRVAGDTVSWGNRMGWGLGLYPKVVDANTLSIGEPDGSIKLANWFKEFKRASHSGTYTYAAPSGEAAESTYTATRF